MKLRNQGLFALALFCVACGPSKLEKASAEAKEASDAEAPDDRSPDEIREAREKAESAHRIVFADRSSMGYLLLLPDIQEPAVPSREALRETVKEKFAATPDDEEVKLLEYYVGLDPKEGELPVEVDPDDPDSAMRTAAARYDLIGLYVDVLPVSDVIPEAALRDPVMTRGIKPELRPTIPTRKWALLLRGDYRSRSAFRGLRLLQALVRAVADDRGALIHDPDTLETMDLDVFSAKRLQSSLGNVADQIVVVPFPDPRHGEEHVRLATRGMRRFGAVDLELDGLPKDPATLQKATDLLMGLAFVMIKDAEVTETGVATELEEAVSITYRDVEAAYRSQGRKIPRCTDCREEALVHLIERPREDHDPEGHVTARVVAPRSESDLPGYDHPAWAKKAIANLLGG